MDHREFICLREYSQASGAGDMVGNKTGENTCPPEVHSPVEGETINKTDTLPRTSEGSEFCREGQIREGQVWFTRAWGKGYQEDGREAREGGHLETASVQALAGREPMGSSREASRWRRGTQSCRAEWREWVVRVLDSWRLPRSPRGWRVRAEGPDLVALWSWLRR